MDIQLYKDSKIYILSPANVATGGVELLHQLSYKINKVLSFNNVFIKYIGEKDGINPTPKDYEKYNVKSISKIEDESDNILIVPEIYTKHLSNFKKIRKIIRWLSIDNYYFNINFLPKIYNYFLLKIFNKQQYICFNSNLRKIDYHLVQSEYAKQHLLNKGISPDKIYYLSDYLNKDFLSNDFNYGEKKDIIAYNPKKGYKFTKKLIKYMHDKGDEIRFVPIKNMTRQEVINLLKSSKIYIDFGYFPGKDRIPREAAILGCIIVISTMGAGGFFKDFPIRGTYKIKNLNDLENIREILINNVDNYNKNVHLFDNYLSTIVNEEENFNKDIAQLFTL